MHHRSNNPIEWPKLTKGNERERVDEDQDRTLAHLSFHDERLEELNLKCSIEVEPQKRKEIYEGDVTWSKPI